MDRNSPILISDSDTEDEGKIDLGPDEISRFIPASLSNSQRTGVTYCLVFENKNLGYSQNSIPIYNSTRQQHNKGEHEEQQNAFLHSPFSYTENAKFTSTSQRSLNDNENMTEVCKTTPGTNTKGSKKSSTEIPYRCLNLRKSGFKIDFEGFTYFDRLGFFKAEEKRARRCLNILQTHIKVRQKTIVALLREHRNRKSCNEDLPMKSLDNTKTKELHVVPSKRCLKQKIIKQNVSQTNTKDRTKLRKTNYTILKDKYMVSKLNVPLYRDKRQPIGDGNKPVTFIDENNFENVEQLVHQNDDKEIYFVNKHKIITALYMDIFPSFKKAVECTKVKITDTAIFVNEKPLLKTSNRNRLRDPKYTTFSNFMENFHMFQKNVELEGNVPAEHNYSVKLY